jgi:hypothetical protein
LSAAADKDIDTYKKAGTFSEEESEKMRSQLKERLEK